MKKTFENKIKGCKTIPWKEIRGYEFNDLKEGENRNVSKLINSIINEGFAFTSLFLV